MIKLFSHSDFDGVSCAVLAKLAFGEDVDIEYCNYNDADSKVEEFFNSELDYECHITDISISEELASRINDSEKKYQLLDHHCTALNLNKFDWCNAQVENENTGIKTSGAELYYHWLVNNNYLTRTDVLDRFVEVVRDYDTWRWKELGEDGVICKQVNDLLYIYGRKKFVDWCIAQINNEVFPNLYASDVLVLEIEQKKIDDYVKAKDKHLFIGDMCGMKCGFVFAEKYSSELGNRLCEMHPEFDFVAIINMDGTVSYRTIRDDIDLGKEVAQVFGGGGHPKAAGSRFSNEVKMNIIKEIFK